MMATATVSSTGPRYAPEDPTLPKPWKGLVDGKTGYLYLWNPETNVTESEKPAASSHTGSAPPQKLSAAPSGKGGSDHSQNVPNEEIGVGHGGSSGRGYGLSAIGNGPSVESYRYQHEITISVGI
ncbi:hypothetical protein LOK49_LG10G01148 [Camellia lanceoleosa]|uniref:Uncharacterized protein n=1 Tax=Camellia lanceoleosa TaxID=1840588 RepID=A0ACC0G6K7_9ERIC|nr:hypothetical protein LOK49_LG10G01148 [Camellia lanceoleosa]